MKLHKLILELQELEKEHGGDIEVRLRAEQHQCLMEATWCGTAHIANHDYCAELVDDEDVCNCPEAMKIIEIQAY